MEYEKTPVTETNFRPPETQSNFSVEAAADSGAMDINSQDTEYKSQIEAADQAKLAEARADIAKLTSAADNWRFNTKQREKNFEVVDGKYTVEYVSKEVLGSSFGMAYGIGTGDYAQVREDLPPRVKRFVKAHELYHLQDTKEGRWFRREIRANLYPGLKDPIGLLATIRASLNRERLALYFDRFKKGY